MVNVHFLDTAINVQNGGRREHFWAVWVGVLGLAVVCPRILPVCGLFWRGFGVGGVTPLPALLDSVAGLVWRFWAFGLFWGFGVVVWVFFVGVVRLHKKNTPLSVG